MAQAIKTRTGGRLVAETLEALGAEVAFGLPGVHALAIWDGVRTTGIRAIGFRTELDAGFAADGYARVSGRAAPLLLSTGPGALNSLTALMEAATAHVPVVAISSQIPRALIGRGRGYLHELPDQLAAFAPVVKWAARAETAEAIPELLGEAWRRALTPPSGPVFLEIPVDLLTGETDVPVSVELDVAIPEPTTAALEEAAKVIAAAEQPVVWAGGGVLRSGAWNELAALAERLDAPVATTYMGKGAFADDDPRSAGSACDEGAFQELLASADVLVCVGTELGAETTGQYGLRPRGRIVQVDAAPERIRATYEALGVVGDAATVLRALNERIPAREPREGAARAARVRERIGAGLAELGHELERGLLAAVRDAVPRTGITAWDMTILAYWAAAYFPAYTPRTFLYPLGSGTLGYAWPAALGAAAARPGEPVVAVVGDGGFLYGLAELATARQAGLRVALVVIDDGGYGILREYQRDSYAETYAVDLEQPDFVAAAQSFGVPAETVEPQELGSALKRALGRNGPALVHVPAGLEPYRPGPSVSELKREHGLDDLAKLNWNEDLFGPLPGAREAVVAELERAWMYPEQAYTDLREALAGWLDVRPEQLVPAHGIQALIAAVAHTFVRERDVVVVPQPTYGLYAQVSAAAGAEIARVPCRDFRLDGEALAEAARRTNARIVWVCDPNNPTGSIFERDEWEALLEGVPEATTIVVDEAYREYADPARTLRREDDVESGRPVVVLRTFSKIFGLAGLRLGYAVVAEELAGFLDVVQEPFNVNRAALAAGRACLADPTAIEARRRQSAEARALLARLVGEAGMRALPSEANFVLVEVGVDDVELAEALVRRGLLVRPGSEFGLHGFVRITVGPPPLMERAAEELASVRDALLAGKSLR